MTPTARSSTLPRRAKALKFRKNFFMGSLLFFGRVMGGVDRDGVEKRLFSSDGRSLQQAGDQ
jgi:hypothetical protein